MRTGHEARPSGARILLRQVRYQNRVFWRTPVAAFFTFAFPLIFLVLFNLFFEGTARTPAGRIPFAQFFTPAIAAFAVITATYTNLAIGTAMARDEGILKRFRGTPLPPWMYLGGRIGSGVWVALLSTVAMFVIGVAFYDVQVVWRTLPAALVTLVVGAAAFSALGLAATALMPTGDAAPAVANATILPLALISGIFFPLEEAPDWVGTLASVFPVKHFVDAFVADLNPLTRGSGFQWASLGGMVAWGVAGVVVALRFFRWEPRAGGLARSRRRPRHAVVA